MPPDNFGPNVPVNRSCSTSPEMVELLCVEKAAAGKLAGIADSYMALELGAGRAAAADSHYTGMGL